MKISEKDLDLLISKVKNNDISSLEYQEDDFSISVNNGNGKISNSDTLLQTDNFEYQTTSKIENQEPIIQSNNQTDNNNNNNDDAIEFYSPLIGNFYLTKDPEAPALVNVGDKITKGDTICVIEAMKMISEVKAEHTGTITEICTEVGSFVDLDTVIFKISEE